jgi:hypothetical protein
MTLRELWNWYLENVAPQTLKQSTIDSRINVMDNHILPEMGHFKLRDINPAMLDKHFTKLQKKADMFKKDTMLKTILN